MGERKPRGAPAFAAFVFHVCQLPAHGRVPWVRRAGSRASRYEATPLHRAAQRARATAAGTASGGVFRKVGCALGAQHRALREGTLCPGRVSCSQVPLKTRLRLSELPGDPSGLSSFKMTVPNDPAAWTGETAETVSSSSRDTPSASSTWSPNEREGQRLKNTGHSTFYLSLYKRRGHEIHATSLNSFNASHRPTGRSPKPPSDGRRKLYIFGHCGWKQKNM